jgi:hypothetical protein
LIVFPALMNALPPGRRRGGGLPQPGGSAKLVSTPGEAKKQPFRRAAQRAIDGPRSVENFAGNHQRNADRAETKLPIPQGHVHDSSTCTGAQCLLHSIAHRQ